MRITVPFKAGFVAPNRADVRRARKGQPLDFTNGAPVEELPPALLRCAALYGFAPTETTCLALHGKGSVLAHTDGLFGNASLVWLVADSRDGESQLMVARGGEAGVMPMNVGDVVLFNDREMHAWVSRSSWAMLVIDVSSMQRYQHRLYRLPKN